MRSLREGHRRASEALAHAESARAAEVSRLKGENELLHERVVESDGLLEQARRELDGTRSILQQMQASRTWKLHLFLDRLRGR